MTDEGKSLIGLGDITKPVTKLVDHIASAIGVLYEPTRITRKAKASAQALILKKEAELVAKSIEQRAITRAQLVEVRRQSNIESIIGKTMPLLDDCAEPSENITADWLTEFFRVAQDISENEIQLLWARVLANASNGKSKYSFRSLDILRQLDSEIAECFRRFSGASISNHDGVHFILTHDVPDESVCETLVEFAQLKHSSIEDLVNAGLVVETQFHALLSNGWFKYQAMNRSESLRLAKAHFNRHLNIFRAYRLTKEGFELSTLTGRSDNSEYIPYLEMILRSCGLFYEPTGQPETEGQAYRPSPNKS